LTELKLFENYATAYLNLRNMFKVIRSNIWNRSNSSADCAILLKVGTVFCHVIGDTLQNLQGQRSKVTITTYNVSTVKRYSLSAAMDRLADFNLCMVS